MKLALFLLLLASSAQAGSIDHHRLADAIYRAEGGDSTRHPYGILSVRVSGKAAARRVCLNTIASAERRWNGRGSFIAHLARTYCPPSVDPVGHVNWVRNVSHFYATSRSR